MLFVFIREVQFINKNGLLFSTGSSKASKQRKSAPSSWTSCPVWNTCPLSAWAQRCLRCCCMKERNTVKSNDTVWCNLSDYPHSHVPYVGELWPVVVSVDKTEQDLKHQQTNLRVLRQREGQQRLQEGAGQRCEHIGGLKTCCYLSDWWEHTQDIWRKEHMINQPHRQHFGFALVFTWDKMISISDP